jgi:phosphatidylserine/phosphatidylglycerophosphate/cardiolipin synthase-like enzyme
MSFEFRCGTGLGEFIMGRVRSGSEVIVVSPWLSPEVAEELVELSKRARVTVITTNDTENQSHMKALNELYTVERVPTKQAEELVRKRKNAIMYIIVGVALMLFLAPLLALISIAGVGVAVGIGLVLFIIGAIEYAESVVYKARAYETRVYPRVNELVVLDRNATKLHAKLIVLPSEGLVGIGSANLTRLGLQSNAECWVWLNDPETVETAMNFVDWLLKQPRQDLSSMVMPETAENELANLAHAWISIWYTTEPARKRRKRKTHKRLN